MIDTSILSAVTFVYFLSFLFYFMYMMRRKEAWGRTANMTALVGLVAHTLALALRWIESYRLGIGHVPLSNFYESLIFFAWAVVFLYLIIEWLTENRIPGVFTMPVAYIFMIYASFSPDVSNRIQPLIPALQSNWLIGHVVACFMGYAAFAIAFAISIMYMLKEMIGKGKEGQSFLGFLPAICILDELIYQSVVLGFTMLSLGIITGSVWAHNAWGSYWNWDPKETWSLITWLIYAALLHIRLIHSKWWGRRTAVLAIIGFLSALFTYLGVNYLPGLHSYLKL